MFFEANSAAQRAQKNIPKLGTFELSQRQQFKKGVREGDLLDMDPEGKSSTKCINLKNSKKVNLRFEIYFSKSKNLNNI